MRPSVRRVRDALLVARFELAEALRSKKVLALLVIHVAGATAGGGIFVAVLRQVENALADKLGLSATSDPGAMTAALFQSKEFEEILGGLIGEPALTAELVSVPPIALFYGWLMLAFVPALAVLFSSDAIASEVATGSCRYSLFRCDRLSWAAGKYLGQATLLLLGVLAGGLGIFVVGWVWLASFEPIPTFLWLIRLGGRAWLYGFAWLGLALGVSQCVRTVPAARALALVALVAVGSTSLFLDSPWALEHAPVVAPTLRQVLPGAHRLDLWRPAPLDRLPAMVMLLALGVVYFSAGHARFARRDA